MTVAKGSMSGLTLADVIRRAHREGPIPIQHCLAIARGLADRLEGIHESYRLDDRAADFGGRFLTPEAVLVGFDGTVHMAGFGVVPTAEMLVTSDPSAAERSTAYMAPEQLRGDIADYRADLYSLGAILYGALTGQRLPQASRGEALTGMHVDAPPDLGEERADSPPELVELLFELLCADPHARPSSAADVSRRLSAQLEERISWEGALELSAFVTRLASEQELEDPDAIVETRTREMIAARVERDRSGILRDVAVVAFLLGLSAALGWIARIFIP